MVKTFLIDLPLLSLYGSIYALLQKKEEGSLIRESAFRWGLLFSSIFIVSVIISYFMAPHWMWMYFPENPKIGVLDWIYILLFLYYLPYAGGYFLARELRKKGFIYGAIVALISLLEEIFIVLRLWDRYTHVGTREEFLNGTANLLWKSSVNIVFNITIPILIVVFIISFIRIRKG